MILKKKVTSNFSPLEQMEHIKELFRIPKYYNSNLTPDMFHIDFDRMEIVMDFKSLKSTPLYIPEMAIDGKELHNRGFKSLYFKSYETRRGIEIISDLQDFSILNDSTTRLILDITKGKLLKNVILETSIIHEDFVIYGKLPNINKILLDKIKDPGSVLPVYGAMVTFEYNEKPQDLIEDIPYYFVPLSEVYMRYNQWNLSKLKKHTNIYKTYGGNVLKAII